jgi:arginine/lysine/ornithine decarboxylase
MTTTTDHQRAPFADALWAYAATDSLPFSTPGHKRGRGAASDLRAALGQALALDIPHAGGVDSTHLGLGLLRQAEHLAAAAWGGDEARYLVNGSTTGNLAMLLATCRDGDEVLVSRMLHKSLLTGLIATGARPVYLTPVLDTERNLPLDIPPASVAAALATHSDARAVVLVSPSYVGVTSDLRGIASICHAAGVPLLVDEAWGPHLHFHPALPDSAMQSGADASVSSTHKLLGALTQGSTLVARRGLLDLERLHAAVDMTQTTSPSALIFTSLDATRRQMALHGRRLLDTTLAHAAHLRGTFAELPGLAVVGAEIVAERAAVGFDPTRIMVDVHRLGVTGYAAEQFLRAQHGVYVEMSDLLSVMLLITPGDDDRAVTRASGAFRSLASERGVERFAPLVRSSGSLLFEQEQVLTPREAYMARAVTVPVTQATGRVSADSLTPYPPGIPLVAPGERLTETSIDYLRAGIAQGMYVSGASDPTLATVRVVA